MHVSLTFHCIALTTVYAKFENTCQFDLSLALFVLITVYVKYICQFDFLLHCFNYSLCKVHVGLTFQFQIPVWYKHDHVEGDNS